MRGSVRFSLGAALAAAVSCAPAQAQQARYAEGGYGGGLIEYLVTGSAGNGGRGWPQRYAPSQRYAAPQAYTTPQRVEAPVRVAAYSGDLLPVEAEPGQAVGVPQPVYGAPAAGAYGAPQADQPQHRARREGQQTQDGRPPTQALGAARRGTQYEQQDAREK